MPTRGRRISTDAEIAARFRARHRVAYLVGKAGLPPAKACLCRDCGAPAKHYDHANGYTGADDERVEPVCARCHGLRSRARGEHSVPGLGATRATPLISLRLEPELVALIDALAVALKTSKTDVIRQAVQAMAKRKRVTAPSVQAHEDGVTFAPAVRS